MKKWLVFLAMAVFVFVAFAPAASAHVTLHPEESSTDAWEKYSVRVPVEKDINTIEVELEVPDEVDLVNVMPTDGWDYELEKDDDENIVAVTWEATDDGIGPNEFTEFHFVGANPSEATDVSWNAYQTYEDDSVVEWDGEPDDEEPASVTKVVEGDAEAEHDDGTEGASDEAAQEGDPSEEGDSSGMSNIWPMGLAILALLLALISLFRKRA